jgi:type II secretory pathway component PulM
MIFQLQTFFNRHLSARLIGAVMFVGALVFSVNTWVVKPIIFLLEAPQLQWEIDKKRAEMDAVQRQLSTTSGNLNSTDQHTVINDLATKIFGQTTTIDRSGPNVTVVTLRAVSAGSLSIWLSELRRYAALSPTNVDLQRDGQTDAWNGRLIFKFAQEVERVSAG